MKPQAIEGLKMIRQGLDIIIKSAEEEAYGVKPCTPKEEQESENDAPVTITKELLEGMTFNDLKKLAKENDIPAKGSRAEITKAILEAFDFTAVEETESDEVEEADVIDDEEEAEAEAQAEEEAQVDDEPETEEQELAVQVKEAVEGMTTDEIADLLSSIGFSPKGKREALIDKLITAVEQGYLSFDDEEETEEEAEDETVDEAEEVEEDVTEPEIELDPANDLENNADITEERAEAIKKFREETEEAINAEQISVEDMRKFLAEFHNIDESEFSAYSDEQIGKLYIDAASLFIDDDGNIVEEDAYMLNGEPACCGHILEHNEETGNYECPICGNSYSIEE